MIKFLLDLSKSIIESFPEKVQKQASEAIGSGIAEGVEKSKKKFFYLGISIALIGTGFFLTLWGIATGIDTIFAMQGLGYVLIGILAILGGALVNKM